jgi:hypothetical protein
MKKTSPTSRRNDQGYALLITIVFIGIALLLLGSVMDWTNSTAKQTKQNNLFSMATAAAEGADERVISQMMHDFSCQTFQAATNYAVANVSMNYYPVPTTAQQSSWPVQFSFTDANGVTNQTSVTIYPQNYQTNWTVLGNQYAGLWAAVANCTVASTATPQNQTYTVPATVSEQFQLASIPLFQFAIFYNMVMEICPGANMTVSGPTYVNGQIWADPAQTLTFGGAVNTTMPSVYYTRNTNCDPQTVTLNPTVVYSVTNSPVTDSPALVLPVGTNSYSIGSTNFAGTNSASSVESILNLPPAGTNPNSQYGQTFLYNEADIVISNAPGGTANTNITAYYQNSNNVSRLTLIPYNVVQITTNVSGHTTTYTTNYSYSFATNATFYDYREGKTVQAVQLNVGALTNWLATAGSTNNGLTYTDFGHYIDSVYVYNNVTDTSSTLAAVRVANGSVLPSQGLTVATPDPLYVLGNYNASGSSLNNGTNVVNAAPAAFMADAITILSQNWNDSLYTSTYALSSRNPVNTTVNAATLEGIVPSVNINGTKYYSGGVENFLRLLENWSSSTTLTYNGSIVVMFNSIYATNYWQSPGNYYNVPTRNWGFDLNFKNQNNLPALTPQAKALVRQQWSSY